MTSSMKSTLFFLSILSNGLAVFQTRAVIDVHLHTDTGKFLPRETIAGELHAFEPKSREEMICETRAVMKQLNIVHAITSGPDPLVVAEWHEADPTRIIPALQVPHARTDRDYLDSIRQLESSGQIAVLGEIAFQYEGIGVSDSA